MVVFVFNNQGKVLMPPTENRIQLLLVRSRAWFHRLVPMVIQITDRASHSCTPQSLRSKPDPGRNSDPDCYCYCCNQEKKPRSIEELLTKYQKRMTNALDYTKKPLRSAEALHATHQEALTKAIKATDLCIELTSGGSTKFNCRNLSAQKTYALDAACVGKMQSINHWQPPTLTLNADYQRTWLHQFGFSCENLMRSKHVKNEQHAKIIINERNDLIQPKARGITTSIRCGVKADRKTPENGDSLFKQTSFDLEQLMRQKFVQTNYKSADYGLTPEAMMSDVGGRRQHVYRSLFEQTHWGDQMNAEIEFFVAMNLAHHKDQSPHTSTKQTKPRPSSGVFYIWASGFKGVNMP